MQNYTCSSCDQVFSKDDVDFDDEGQADTFLLQRGDVLDASVVQTLFGGEDCIGTGSCTCIFLGDVECPNCSATVEVFVEAEVHFTVGEDWQVDSIEETIINGVTDANESERVDYDQV